MRRALSGPALTVALALLFVSAAAPRVAADAFVPEVVFYTVDAPTIDGLVTQMAERGPRGYWAYAEWYVRWSAACEVTLTGTITFPRHPDATVLPRDDMIIWNDMLVALMTHELQHIAHGVSAAEELREAGCRNGNAIIARWAAEDLAYDARTRHGLLEGVDLR